MIGGVCAGLGDHLDVDPTVIRLIRIAVTILSIGVGIVVYLIAWIIVPEGSDGGEAAATGTVLPGPGRQN
jgi:phage shock protein PspC (stress-responsive transcriptional regulator)